MDQANTRAILKHMAELQAKISDLQKLYEHPQTSRITVTMQEPSGEWITFNFLSNFLKEEKISFLKKIAWESIEHFKNEYETLKNTL